MKTYQEFITEAAAFKIDKKRVKEWTLKVMDRYRDDDNGKFAFYMDGRGGPGFRDTELAYGWSFIEARTKAQKKENDALTKEFIKKQKAKK